MQKHWVWLATRSGIGVRGRAELLRRFGTAERIYAMDRAALQAEEGLRRSWLEPLLDKTLDGAERILAQCDRFDIRLLTYAEPAYPERLRNIADPPALLYYQGRLPDFDHEAAIAVVGSRRCSAYGLLHAKKFSRLIAASGGLVMSGGARGIDTMALQSAMDLPEPVVCVLACGLDIAYPPENGQLFAQIASRGCLLSEYPPGTSPMRGNFPVRNRILSGLSVGVLVVEASAQSGALITARLALEQGRDVFAIPGNLGVASCEGTNRLLREGALMPENGWELLQEYTHLFPGKLADGRRREVMEQRFGSHYAAAVPAQPLPERPAKPARPAAPSPEKSPALDKKDIDNPPARPYSDRKKAPPALSGDEAAVYAALTPEPILADLLTEHTGLPPQRLLAAMTMLQIKGLAKKLPGNRYQRAGG